MNLVDLAFLYLLAGAACAVALYRRAAERTRGALVNAALAVPLWPLWAPIAWTARNPRPDLDPGSSGVIGTIRGAFEEGLAAVAGTPLQALLNDDAVSRMLEEVDRVAARRQELLTLLGRSEFGLGAADARLAALEAQQASPRARASARLHLENVRRLHALAERDGALLEELGELAQALRTQLVFARVSGSSAEGVGDLVSELWTRIDSLREASDEVLNVQTL